MFVKTLCIILTHQTTVQQRCAAYLCETICQNCTTSGDIISPEVNLYTKLFGSSNAFSVKFVLESDSHSCYLGYN